MRPREIETPCAACAGTGRKWYSNTSGWRRGVGGQSLTEMQCDACWGSGDAAHPWENLRELEAHYEQRIASATFANMIDVFGFNGATLRHDVQGVVDVLKKVDDGVVLRGKLDFGVRRMAGLLAGRLQDMLAGEAAQASSETQALKTELAGHIGANLIRSVLHGPSRDSEVIQVNKTPTPDPLPEKFHRNFLYRPPYGQYKK